MNHNEIFQMNKQYNFTISSQIGLLVLVAVTDCNILSATRTTIYIFWILIPEHRGRHNLKISWAPQTSTSGRSMTP